MLILGGSWSAYWYNGFIYSSEIARGLDILELTPSRYISQNEIDAAKSVRVAELNVQTQQKFVFPNSLKVAKAYIDQLERSNALTETQGKTLRAEIDAAVSSKLSTKDVEKLKTHVGHLEQMRQKGHKFCGCNENENWQEMPKQSGALNF